MIQDFYKKKLVDAGVDVFTPEQEEIKMVNSVIYDELCLGIVSPNSREKYVRVIQNLKRKGAKGVILGCTEIGLLIRQEDVALPVFDTARIHAEQAALRAIGKE